MEWIAQNWSLILTILVFIAGGVKAVLTFNAKTKEQKIETLKAFLLQACLKAEIEFGSKTGRIKLSQVYSDVCSSLPWVAKAITFEEFSNTVDEILVELRNMLSSNEKVAAIIDKTENKAE
ncbi:MAG: hypothetical protein IJS58_05550 [Bacilli bacterium]|nr:hypothetical protein [Bacilli bacterium]